MLRYAIWEAKMDQRQGQKFSQLYFFISLRAAGLAKAPHLLFIIVLPIRMYISYTWNFGPNIKAVDIDTELNNRSGGFQMPLALPIKSLQLSIPLNQLVNYLINIRHFMFTDVGHYRIINYWREREKLRPGLWFSTSKPEGL